MTSLLHARPKTQARPPACLAARMVRIILRKKGTNEYGEYDVVIPAGWSKSVFLKYVRDVHPDDTAKIITWREVKTKHDEPVLWLANPRAFSNFKTGVRV